MKMNKLVYLAFIIVISNCASYKSYYKYTVFTNKEHLKKLLIAPVDILWDDKQSNIKQTDKVLVLINSYLASEKIETYLIGGEYALICKRNSENIGGIYDKNTGEKNQEKFNTVLKNSIKQICSLKGFDGILFAKICIRKALLNGPFCYWDGVKRQIDIRVNHFDYRQYQWSGDAKAISLKIEIYSNEGRKVFESFGGIGLANKLESANMKIESVTRNEILEDTTELLEAIKIAMHPLISYEKYPTKPKFFDNTYENNEGITLIPIQNETLKDMKKWDKF